MNSSWEIKIYRTWAEVDDPLFIDQWEAWIDTASMSHVFSHPLLIKIWTDIYRALWDIVPFYIVAKQQDVMVFLPLVLWKRNWKAASTKVLIPAGYRDYDYHDPIVIGTLSEPLIYSFWEAVLEMTTHSDIVNYDEIELIGIRYAGENHSWQIEETCPVADLTKYDDYAHFFGQLDKKLKKDIERSKRRLEELGKVSFHAYGPNELQEASKILPEVLKIHSQKWPNSCKIPGFYESLLQNGLIRGIVHFTEIRIDNKPISWHYCFRYKYKEYGYMQVYLPEYAKYSPGKIHLSCLFEDCFNSEVEIFDFMRGSEEYKGSWTNTQSFVYQNIYRKKNISSQIKLGAYDFIRNLK